MSNEREQLIARLRRFAVVLEARGETYDAETCEQAIASLSAPPAEPRERVLLERYGVMGNWREVTDDMPARSEWGPYEYRYATLDSEEA